MHITKMREWDKISLKWKSLVDVVGQLDGLDEKDDKKEASKSLVFMLVNINGHFKVPVVHYLINSLNGTEAILIKHLLIK